MRFLRDYFLLIKMKMQNHHMSTDGSMHRLLPPSLNRHLLFYSRNCQDCSDVICSIRKNATRSSYMLICIDDGHDIPSCVDTVPTIMNCHDGGILKGMESVNNFVTTSCVKAIEPSSASGDLLRGARGDTFSFLDDQVCEDGYSCYLPINMIEHGTHNINPTDRANNTKISDRSVTPDNVLEGLKQQRDRDENEFRMSLKT